MFIGNNIKNHTSKIVLPALNPHFFDSDFCRYWLLSRLHPDQPQCPECHKKLEGLPLQSFWDGKNIQCHGCGKKFSARTGTILSRLRLDYNELILLLILFDMELSFTRISKMMNLSRKTLYDYYKRFQSISGFPDD